MQTIRRSMPVLVLVPPAYLTFVLPDVALIILKIPAETKCRDTVDDVPLMDGRMAEHELQI